MVQRGGTANSVIISIAMGIHDKVIQDALVVVVASVLGYLFKFVLKPNEREIRFISGILYLLVTILIKWAQDHIDVKYSLDKARKEFVHLKSRVSNKVEIG